eukprot:scaffold33586_cov21-Tisochrysis_lutea.AAC.1
MEMPGCVLAAVKSSMKASLRVLCKGERCGCCALEGSSCALRQGARLVCACVMRQAKGLLNTNSSAKKYGKIKEAGHKRGQARTSGTSTGAGTSTAEGGSSLGQAAALTNPDASGLTPAGAAGAAEDDRLPSGAEADGARPRRALDPPVPPGSGELAFPDESSPSCKEREARGPQQQQQQQQQQERQQQECLQQERQQQEQQQAQEGAQNGAAHAPLAKRARVMEPTQQCARGAQTVRNSVSQQAGAGPEVPGPRAGAAGGTTAAGEAGESGEACA